MSVIERLSTTTVTFRDRWLRLGRIARYTTWLEWPEPDIVLALLLGSVVVGCAAVAVDCTLTAGSLQVGDRLTAPSTAPVIAVPLPCRCLSPPLMSNRAASMIAPPTTR